MPAFTFRSVKNLYPMFWNCSKQLINNVTLGKYLGLPTGDSDDILVEVKGWANRATLDIIGMAGLDQDLESLQNPEGELSQNYRRLFTPTMSQMIQDGLAMVIPVWMQKLIPLVGRSVHLGILE